MNQSKYLRAHGLLSLPLAALLAGCASPPAAAPDVVPVGAAQARYVLPGAVFGSMSTDAIVRQYARALSDASQYRGIENREGVVSGVEAKPQAEGVALAYLKHASATMYHDYRANYDVKLSRIGADVVADVVCPSTMTVEYRSGALAALSWSPFIERSAAVADLKMICGKAYLKGAKHETGEVNVNFPDSSVYANFARKLRPASQSWRDTARVSKDDLAKFKWFEMPDGKITRVVGITVFPYRAGSKVTFQWDNEAVCRANVACQFDAAAPQRVQAMVSSIAND